MSKKFKTIKNKEKQFEIQINENYGVIYTIQDLLVDILENMYYKKLMD